MQNKLKEQVKVIIFDIDDTLYEKYQDNFVESAQYALKELIKNGYQVVICTGRANCSLPDKIVNFIEEHKLQNIITINGQVVCSDGKIINSNPISVDTIEKVLAFCKEHKLSIAQVGDSGICLDCAVDRTAIALDAITVRYEINSDLYKTHDIYQLLIFSMAEEDHLYNDFLDSLYLKSIRWHEYSADIIPKNASKARGIKKFLEYKGIKPEQVMAFGDGSNDIEMLEYVGFGVAMGNAGDKLKSVAQYVTDHILEDGIYNALVKFDFIAHNPAFEKTEEKKNT